jgi:hypothetical protein
MRAVPFRGRHGIESLPATGKSNWKLVHDKVVVMEKEAFNSETPAWQTYLRFQMFKVKRLNT